MIGKKRTHDDRSRLSKNANAALDAVLPANEHVRVIIPGTHGSALVGTETRGFIWKKDRLSTYPYENLTTVAFSDGHLLRWAQFRGPSIGRTEPSLGNIAGLLDAIQVDGGIDKDARGEIERLVSSGARSIPGFAPGTVLPGARLVRDSKMPGGEMPLMEADGSGGHLWLFDDRVRINHHGLRGAMTTGVLKGDKEIALDQITAVQWRDPGLMWLGHIQFSFMGGSSDARMASKDENAVLFKLRESAHRVAAPPRLAANGPHPDPVSKRPGGHRRGTGRHRGEHGRSRSAGLDLLGSRTRRLSSLRASRHLLRPPYRESGRDPRVPSRHTEGGLTWVRLDTLRTTASRRDAASAGGTR
jgi:Domain of unknown function (DUF4429)